MIWPNIYKMDKGLHIEVKEMKRMLVVLLIAGLLMGTLGVVLCDDEPPSGGQDLPDEWLDGSPSDVVPCGGGVGGGGGIPG
jgi:hypothetical protein